MALLKELHTCQDMTDFSQTTTKLKEVLMAWSISRFKLSEGHRKMSLFFSGSTQWEAWVTKPQLFVLMPSQHASVSNGTQCPAAGHDISFLVSDGLLGLSFILAQWPIRLQA